MQRLDQFVTAHVGELDPILRDDAEVLEQLLQKVVAFEQRVVDEREKRLAPEFLQYCPAQECLAAADLAGDDDQRLAPLKRVGDLGERGRMRRARKQESSVGSEAEWRLVQSEERLVPLHSPGLLKCSHGYHSTHRDR